MTIAFDFVAALVGLCPPDAAIKSKRPAFSKPRQRSTQIRGELSRQPEPTLITAEFTTLSAQRHALTSGRAFNLDASNNPVFWG
jgi:hypothetical protein